MLKILLLFSFITIGIPQLNAKSAETDYGKVKCPETKVLARELLNRELKGWRNPWAQESCLTADLFAHFPYERIEYGDKIPDKNFFRVQNKDLASLKIIGIKPVNDITYRVEFSYYANRPKGPRVRVQDRFEMMVNNEQNKKYLGCAGLTVWPEHLFTQQSCLRIP